MHYLADLQVAEIVLQVGFPEGLNATPDDGDQVVEQVTPLSGTPARHSAAGARPIDLVGELSAPHPARAERSDRLEFVPPD